MNSDAQDKVTRDSDILKNENGISLNAPDGVHQYAFRIGEWESISKSLQINRKWQTITGRYRVYVADNGVTFIEEGLDHEGNVIHRITFNYNDKTDSWQNIYTDLKTAKEVKYTSKLIDGNMVETIVRENSTNNNTYTVVDDNVYIYTSRRTFNNDITIVNHVGISTKINH